MKKIISIFLLLGILFSSSCRCTEDVAVAPRQSKTYLVAGIDDVAENTDVLILASYTMANGTATLVHIPRDTLCKYGGKYRKINGIFPFERTNGRTKEGAMSCLSSYISEVFGVDIDGYFCIDRETLIKAVDLMGGVDIELDENHSIKGDYGEILYALEPGKNHLDGESAADFIRYRKEYTNGDLGRINAQKLFLSTFFKKAREDIGIDGAVKMYVAIMPRITTNVGLPELLEVLLNAGVNTGKNAPDYVTLPGEATMLDNVSFYIINRKNAAEVFKRDFAIKGNGLDPERLLTDKNNCIVENIYNK